VIKYHGGKEYPLTESNEVVSCQPLRRNEMRELKRGNQSNTEPDVARTSGQIIVSTRER
jgi:hypothetical protein